MALDFSEEELEEILSIFKEESEELIQNLNESLLALENDPSNTELINKIFRDSHSIKGAAKMVGFDHIGNLAHKIEDIFNLARNGSLEIKPDHIDILCKSVDCIVKLIESLSSQTKKVGEEEIEQIIEHLENIKNTPVQETISVRQESPPPKHIDLPKQETVPLLTEEQNIQEKPLSIEQVGAVDLTIEEFNNLQTIFMNEIREKFDSIMRYFPVIEAGTYDIETIYNLYKTIYSIEGAAQTLNNIPVENIAKTIREIFEHSYKTNTQIELNQLTDIKNLISQIYKLIETVKTEEDAPECLFNLDEEQVLNSLTHNLTQLKEGYTGNHHTETIIDTINNLLKKHTIQQERVEYQILVKILQFFQDAISKNLNINPGIIDIVEKNIEPVIQSLEDPAYVPANYEPNLVLQQLDVLYQAVSLMENNPDLLENTEESIVTTTLQTTEIKKTPTPAKISEPPPPIEEAPKKPLIKKTKSVLSPTGKMESHDVLNEVVSNQKIESYTIKTLRVDTKKLDQLVNQVGELIVAKIKAKETISEIEDLIMNAEEWQRSWSQAKNSFKYIDKKPFKTEKLSAGTSIYSQRKNIFEIAQDNTNHLNAIMYKLHKLYHKIQDDDGKLSLLIDELEDKIKNVRLLPLATIFNMFPRMIRDIAREEKKEINVHITGSETTVDKKIIEEIKNPLIHIIRNALDHGIETPEERLRQNKPEAGTIVIAAKQLESSVLLEITDDGRGINLEKIKHKIIEKNLLSETELEAMNENQIMNVIFWPGFSTKDTVTEISGRGVGLDVVYTKISQLNGKISLLSNLGQGSKITIQLPVTMATLRVFIVLVENQIFAIPASAIYFTSLFDSDKVFYKQGKQNILIDNKPIPINSLAELLEFSPRINIPTQEKQPANSKAKKIVVVLNVDNSKFAVIVDKLLGDQEVLHKNLSLPFIRVRNISGVTTLGAGEVCLMLNPNDLLRTTQSKYGMENIQTTPSPSKLSTKRQVLVVDDSVTTRILERNILKAAGYDVTVAVNGLDALSKLTSKKFDVIVSDVEMPDINGIELTKRVKGNDSFRHIPIILVTSLASEADRQRGLGAGASAYITKGNFDQGELLGKVKQLIM